MTELPDSPHVDSEWTLFVDRDFGRILVLGRHADGFDRANLNAEVTHLPTDPDGADDEESPLSMRVWRNSSGDVVVAECIVEDYVSNRVGNFRQLGRAAAELYEALFDGDRFLEGPPTLWNLLYEAGFVVFTSGQPRSREQRSADLKRSLAEAQARARRNADRRAGRA